MGLTRGMRRFAVFVEDGGERLGKSNSTNEFRESYGPRRFSTSHCSFRRSAATPQFCTD